MMKKGFTLFEILVASSIFAMVMVITTGVIAQMSSYNNKIKLSKNVSEETRKIADQISTDVRQAVNEKGTSFNLKAVYEAYCPPNISDIAEFHLCQRRNNMTPSAEFASASSNANTLIITTKDYVVVYYSNTDKKAIYRLVYKNDKAIFTNGNFIESDTNLDTFRAITGDATDYEQYRLTRTDTEASVNFAGFTSGDGSTTLQQPYVQFYIVSQSKDYDTTTVPSQKAKAELRSMVTSRSYAN